MGSKRQQSSGSGNGYRNKMNLPVAGGDVLMFLGEMEFLTRQNRIGRRLRPAQKSATAPTISASKATMAFGSRLILDTIQETPSFTLIFTMRAASADVTSAANRPGLVGFDNGTTGGAGGAGVYVQSNLILRTALDYASVRTVGADITSYVAGEFAARDRMIALVVTSGVGSALYDLTKKVQNINANAGVRTPSPNPLWIGGQQPGHLGSGDYHFCYHAPIAHSKAEIDQIAGVASTWLLENRGIDVRPIP